jgi:phosphohistidine phosphatase SixA
MRLTAYVTALLFLALLSPARAVDPGLVTDLRKGGYVIIFRHGATDESQKDVYPLNFSDMKAQRQLSAKGREVAAQIGQAMKKLKIPVGQVITSKLYRAVETGKILSGKDVEVVDALTDSGAGSASAMANPNGANQKAGAAVRGLVNTPPKGATNTVLVTHKTNFADAFGKDAADVQEGEAFIYKPERSGEPKLIGRMKATDWTAAASG